MPHPAPRTALAALALLLAAVPACAPAGQAPAGRSAADRPAPAPAPAPAHPAPDPFLRLYDGYQVDYEPAATVTELADRSEVVALAQLTEIREGRILGTSRGDPARAEHLVYVFRVTRQLQGTLPGALAYVEALKPSFEPATRFDATAPKGTEALLYLRRAIPAAAGEPSVPAPQPPPAGAPLMWFTTPQGFLVRLGGRVAHPLEQAGPGRPLFAHSTPDPANLYSWLPPRLVPR
ncbi:MAG TPA: hypothetical protein VMU51_35150 [Mycobacteriales bacterium]|nr:hypothetical protein [Mycobacteriales bacterium]